MGRVKIIQGNALEALRGLEDESVHCVVTSPPYWGLRDYHVEGQLGLEPTPSKYVASLVAVFEEVRRVLRGDGTLWLNLGDSYASKPTGSRPGPTLNRRNDTEEGPTGRPNKIVEGLKPKDLVGIPWLVAFAMRGAGWYLRQDVIWHKPNTLPEVVKDRPVSAHEHVFLFAKSERYFFDEDAIKVRVKRTPRKVGHDGGMNDTGWNSKQAGSFGAPTGTRKSRSVWTIPTHCVRGAHFATFPRRLVEPCVKAGSPADGVVLDPFMGSGTTGIVALSLGRRFVGVELNPEYVELARTRIASETKFTRREATR